ncbi:oxidoreductase [Streptomyces sp. NRRL F-4489]|uniref:aldo/keto reductase n=1 Tax=Streptomyces sp. NRRL F-4489 TaxID=1609095 RepID=UPI000745F791|nr:aldo/keto reductase [Streptomyces sp. NRRL F-4489]KUL37261.1 oxidoreductase [Streptomyces sp. NRRL F-4489]
MATQPSQTPRPAPPAYPDPFFTLGGELATGRLGYGTASLAGPGYWGARHADPERSVALLRRAVDAGVTLIDTADNYGPDVAEELVARALHPYPDGLVIATKGGVVRTGPDSWHIAGRPERLRAMCDASLRRLRTETIDLYQLHRLDPDVPMADQLGALLELQQAGKIRHIGLDTISAAQLAQARELAPIASVQNRYNLLDRASEDVLRLCEETGTAFLPWFPLGNGTLTGAAGSAPGPAADTLASIAATHGATPGQIALAWLLHRSPVLLPTPGTSSPAHLDENLAAAGIHLTAAELTQLNGLAQPTQPASA